ncbi:hypothetical protein BpHYR1_051673, partial [Brachionus plicatilis]
SQNKLKKDVSDSIKQLESPCLHGHKNLTESFRSGSTNVQAKLISPFYKDFLKKLWPIAMKTNFDKCEHSERYLHIPNQIYMRKLYKDLIILYHWRFISLILIQEAELYICEPIANSFAEVFVESEFRVSILELKNRSLNKFEI